MVSPFFFLLFDVTKFKFARYGATCEYMVQSALVLLRESSRIPGDGGVLTPGYAFKDTTFVERCNMNEVPFTAVVKDI